MNSNVVIGYIYIDNYDDAFENVSPIKKPLLQALLDRRLNNFSKNIDGVLSKFDRDRYIVIFTNEKLEKLKEEKFEILNEIRNIELENKMPITLSIGIGTGNKELNVLAEQARAATDFALSRGGDQVVIKDGDKYEFFGGTGKEHEKNSRVKARVKAHILTELILEADNVFIMGHKNPDFDSIGSCIGIYNIVNSVCPNIKCNIILNEISSAISNLFERNNVTKELDMNIFINNKSALEQITSKTLIIVCDSFRANILECSEILNLSKHIVVFDHHRKAADSIEDAVLVYHDTSASSTAELVTEMLMYIKGDIKLSSIEADVLLAGITVDTKGFIFKTGSKTFEAAAFLRKNGADSQNVHLLLQNSKDIYKCKTDVVNNAEIFNNKFALAEYKGTAENSKLIIALSADELLNLKHITMSFVYCHIDDKIHVSARSIGNYNVQTIMEKFGGGGHKTVAAAQVSDMTVESFKEKIKKVLSNIEEEKINESDTK